MEQNSSLMMITKFMFIFITGPSNSESISQALLYLCALFCVNGEPKCENDNKVTCQTSQHLVLSLTPLNTLRIRMENSWRRQRAAMNFNGMSEHCRVKIDRKLSFVHWVMLMLSIMNPSRGVMELFLKQRECLAYLINPTWYSICNCDTVVLEGVIT